MALVSVDIEDYLDEVSSRYLVAELQRRREKGDKTIPPDEPIKVTEALKVIKNNGCPKELYRLLEEWATGHLSIVDCMALQNK